MNRKRPAAPWRRLAPLAIVVLAVHVALLRWQGPELLRVGAPRVHVFETRTIAPVPAPAPVPPPPAKVAVAAPEPDPVAPPRPAPRPRHARTPPAAARPEAPAAATSTEPEAPPVPGRVPSDLDSGSPVAMAAPALPAAAPAPPAPATTNGAPPLLALPAPATLHFEATVQWHGFPLRGQAQLAWRQDGKEYDARLEIASPGLPSRIQHSTGRITSAGLAPLYFSDKARKEQATHFDRDHGRLVFSNNRPDAALTDGMQDRLSVVVQLSALVGGAPSKFPPGTRITVPTASTGDAEDWVFSVEGIEDLQLPGGRLEALRLQRLPRKEYDQKVELWLAPRLDYAPVRLRLTNPNGDTADLRWSSTDRG